jgi:hypothetical protein
MYVYRYVRTVQEISNELDVVDSNTQRVVDQFVANAFGDTGKRSHTLQHELLWVRQVGLWRKSR